MEIFPNNIFAIKKFMHKSVFLKNLRLFWSFREFCRLWNIGDENLETFKWTSVKESQLKHAYFRVRTCDTRASFFDC